MRDSPIGGLGTEMGRIQPIVQPVKTSGCGVLGGPLSIGNVRHDGPFDFENLSLGISASLALQR
jgi:hypothetical protein